MVAYTIWYFYSYRVKVYNLYVVVVPYTPSMISRQQLSAMIMYI